VTRKDSTDDRGFLGRLIRHPWTTVVGGLGLAGQSLGVVDPLGLTMGLATMITSTAGTWFPLLGVLKGLGGMVAWIPTSLAEQAFIVGAVLYAGYLALSLFDSWTDRINDILNRNNS
jgi:hypothetical protein